MSRLYAPLMALRAWRIGNKDDPTYIEDRAFDLSGAATSEWLSSRLLDDRPLMAARFGNTELNNLIPVFLQSRAGFMSNLAAYLRGGIPQFWFKEFLLQEASLNAGIFPYGRQMVRRYAALILEQLPQIDLLGCWLHRERYLRPLFPQAVRVPATELCEPYLAADPWSRSLAGQRVLVVHPFAETIARQYRQHRSQLFADQRVLPEFELLTVTALQSNAGNHPEGLRDWFEAYDRMCGQIERVDFDIALIGCGAYGMPLAAHVKRLGRKGVQMASSLQLLFGIRGRRWDDTPFAARFYNPAWARPSAAETPRNIGVVENGCYW